MEDSGNWGSNLEAEQRSDFMVELAGETEELALREKEGFSSALTRWHPVPAAVAAVTLHDCYGVVLKQYLEGVVTLTQDSIRVLEAADKLEKMLVQIAVEDSEECEDGGKSVVREMIPYEVDAVYSSLTKSWIDERLNCCRECFYRAKDTEASPSSTSSSSSLSSSSSSSSSSFSYSSS